MSQQEHGFQGVEPGDLVFHGLDGFAGAVGVSDSSGKCSPVYHVCASRMGDQLSFVAYTLRAMSILGYLEAQAGSVRQRSIDFRNWYAFATLEIPRPPIGTQIKIVDFLDTETARLDMLIAKKQELSQRLQERRDSATEHVILGAEGPQRPIAALADYINGWPFKPTDLGSEGLPVIRIQQLVDPEAEPDRFQGRLPEHVRLRDGDLVFSWSGSLQVRQWTRGPAWLNQHLFRVLPAKGISKRWLLYALTVSTRLFESHMHGSAMTHITRPMMKSVRIPVPKCPAQEAIAKDLDKLWRETNSITSRLVRQINLLAEHRQALITAAVTGQLKGPGVAA
jgi:type I restriction enzyme S subunit